MYQLQERIENYGYLDRRNFLTTTFHCHTLSQAWYKEVKEVHRNPEKMSSLVHVFCFNMDDKTVQFEDYDGGTETNFSGQGR